MSEQKNYYEELLDLSNDFYDKASSLMESPEIVTLFLNYVAERICEKISVDGCAIMIIDGEENTISVRSWHGTIPPPYKLPDYILHDREEVAEHFRDEHFSLDDDNIFSEITKEAKPLRLEKPLSHKKIFQNGEEDFLKCGSYIFVPLAQKDFVFGLLLISRNSNLQPFAEREFIYAQDIVKTVLPSMIVVSRFLKYQEHSGIVKNNELAMNTQKALFPKNLPAVPNVSVGLSHVDGDVTWGDYYDIMYSTKTKVHFIMIDVVGRGMYSLYILLIVRAMLRLAVNFLQDAASLLTWVNRGLFSENVTDNHFASLSIVSYDISSRSAEIATAGINSVFYFDSGTKSLSRLSKTSDPLGMMDKIKYVNLSLQCKPGDITLICTDGLIESVGESGEQYGASRLARVIKKHADLQGKELAKKVKEDVAQFCGSATGRDDQTLLAIKVEG